MIFLEKKTLLLLFFATFIHTSAYADGAGTSLPLLNNAPWKETQGGRVRVLLVEHDTVDKPQNSAAFEYNGVIEVNLKEGWKTYWRNPGNSGMAPFFTFTQNVQYKIDYPAPQLLGEDGYRVFGYTGNINIPFRLTYADGEQRLSGTLTIGICKEICMPVDVPFNFDLKGKAGDSGIISANDDLEVRALLPKKADDSFQVTGVRLEKDAFLVTVRHSLIKDIPELFMDGGVTELGVAEVVSSKDDETTYRVPLLYLEDDWDGRIFYTAKSKEEAVSGRVNAPRGKSNH